MKASDSNPATRGLDTCIMDERIVRFKNGITACDEALARPDLQLWERKEYQAVKEDYKDKIKASEQHRDYIISLIQEGENA